MVKNGKTKALNNNSKIEFTPLVEPVYNNAKKKDKIAPKGSKKKSLTHHEQLNQSQGFLKLEVSMINLVFLKFLLSIMYFPMILF